MQLPARIGDYTDFYSSYHHAHQRRHDVARRGERAHAELEMDAGRLSRPRQFHRAERNGRAPPARPDQTARCGRADFQRRAAAFDFELETAFLIGTGNSLGEPVPIDAGRRAYLRHGADERLERARYADVGIPAARAFSGEEFLHQHLALGGDDGRARAFPETAPGAGSGAVAVSARERTISLSTSNSRRICARARWTRRTSSRAQISGISTGAWRSSSRITP